AQRRDGEDYLCEVLDALNLEPSQRASERALQPAIEWISLEDGDNVVEAIQLDLQEEILDSADGVEASHTPGATQNQQDSRVLDDEFEVEDLRHPKQPPPSYAEVADLFNALEVRAADAFMEDIYPFF
ncbi:unnamed protein product, partial [Ascophyllum nodosum]